ncbi:hypothetical protein TNCV_2604461 [Trichonephila clavipes]|nr:hypothetical protein TNCV_2604461 [Trichonephila clavipes]
MPEMCGQPHKTSDCSIKEKIETPTCINCNTKGHMANWYECPAFPKVKPKKGDAAQNRNSNKNQSNFNPTSNLVKKDFSYANTTQNTQQRAAHDDSKSVHSEPKSMNNLSDKSTPPSHDNNLNNRSSDDNFSFIDAMREFKILFQEFPFLIEMGKALRNAEKHEKVDIFYKFACNYP